MKPEEAEIVLGFMESYNEPRFRTGVEEVSTEANDYFKMLYDAEIYNVDANLKRFIHHLERIGVLGHTIFTFTSDHGEGFREHGFYGHGTAAAYDELVHVPLIFSGGPIPKGVRVPHNASMVDFFPTLLELAGATPPDYITGSPMFAQNGELLVNADRLTYTDIDFHSDDTTIWDACIVDGKYKVSSRKAQDTYWIFDLDADPGEFENLYGTGKLPETEERALVAKLHEQVGRYEKLGQQFGEPVWMEAADGVHEELQALGYL
jgi:arylsulfatase A-like enzyme